MAKIFSYKQQEIIISKLQKIIGPEKNKMFPEKDIEIENARIKNTLQGIAAYGAQLQNFIGMLTVTIAGDENRISPMDDLEVIINKTVIAYDSINYYVDKFRRFLNKKGFKFIYVTSFELQKDGNLHAHIYFSVPLKAFSDFFVFYHEYKKTFTEPKKINKGKKTIIPIGRSQLGISKEFLHKLTEAGYEFKCYSNPQKPERFDWRCVNFVSEQEFKSGNWPTLFFYDAEAFAKLYSEKILEYLQKNNNTDNERKNKSTAQKVVGSNFVKHNSKAFFESDEWKEMQKQFIRKICGRVYTSSRLPIPVSAYQKKRKEIMEIYPQYRNFNTLITDYLNGKATYENGILTCPNGKSIKLK
ncbi:hypothetical protein LNAT_P0327 [Lebetimonas natsushimae]|uniref:Bacteriophage replication gene A protein n=1 Tax=Lebetimonas natsushimae TaxID=1936991 RepID=A0A292Y8A9_9BACT|nr:hypothetical protein [Lebetimonas natsushimae]GAX87032.1 hypothetical protein LNAT_P0327 [Lebetimonas natsushimae]